jgi:hypothetical protein
MKTSRSLAACVLLLFAVVPCPAAPTVELTVDGQTHQGKSLAHNGSVCWLALRDGSLREIRLADVAECRKVSEDFRPAGSLEIRDMLRRTYGQRYEIVTRGQYVVCAPSGRAREYADLLDQVFRSVHGYFSRRGFQLPRLEYPLVVIIAPDFEQFAAYAREEGVRASPLMHGYYHALTNRIALYEGNSDAVRETLVHEAVHQLAFNYGLHTRTGQNPRWVVEGLATMLEVDGSRPAGGGSGSSPPGR